MKITRIYTGSDGESHFEAHDLVLEQENQRWHSAVMEAKEVKFRETGGDYHHTWHNAPHRQFVVMLEGELEIEIGDGSVRRFRAGDVILAEDTTGRGHISRAANGQRRLSAVIVLG